MATLGTSSATATTGTATGAASTGGTSAGMRRELGGVFWPVVVVVGAGVGFGALLL